MYRFCIIHKYSPMNPLEYRTKATPALQQVRENIIIKSLKTNYFIAQFSTYLNVLPIPAKIYHWHLDLFLVSIWITERYQQHRALSFGLISSGFTIFCLCFFFLPWDKILTLKPWQNDDILSINDGFKSAGEIESPNVLFHLVEKETDAVEYL